MRSASPSRILFITWDSGETSYLEGLFLPIFRELQGDDYKLHILQFTWDDSRVRDRRAVSAELAGIPYRRVPVSRFLGPVGPFATAVLGAREIRSAIRDWSIDTLMPRSLMPALAVLSLKPSERRQVRIVFDADGLAADERVDFGHASPHSLSNRLLRDIEAEMLRCADVVLARTEPAIAILKARKGAGADPLRYCVVGNGIDPTPFTEALEGPHVSAARPFTLCYSGSLGPQYRLPDMLDLACALKERVPDLKFRVFTPSVDQVRRACEGRNLTSADWIEASALRPNEVPRALAECDIGIALRQRAFSTQAVLPVKLGEYLLAGLPIVGTPGVGPTATLEQEGVFRSGEFGDIERTMDWICKEARPARSELRKKCHEIGMRDFSLAGTARLYREALQASPTR